MVPFLFLSQRFRNCWMVSGQIEFPFSFLESLSSWVTSSRLREPLPSLLYFKKISSSCFSNSASLGTIKRLSSVPFFPLCQVDAQQPIFNFNIIIDRQTKSVNITSFQFQKVRINLAYRYNFFLIYLPLLSRCNQNNQMAAINTKACLVFMMIYSFFICFIMNIFGYALSYDQLTYEWNIPNIYEGRKAVFNAAFIHFLIFLACVIYYLKRKVSKRIQFKKVKSSESDFIQAEDNDIV